MSVSAFPKAGSPIAVIAVELQFKLFSPQTLYESQQNFGNIALPECN